MKNKRTIKSERVQKMVINDIFNRCSYTSTYMSDYRVEIENPDSVARMVVVSPAENAAHDFITSPALTSFVKDTSDIQEKYYNVFWCVAARPRYTENGELYNVAVIEFHVTIAQNR